MTAGDCGRLFDSHSSGRLTCELPAGHEGWHQDGSARWPAWAEPGQVGQAAAAVDPWAAAPAPDPDSPPPF
jgi:hypothetical protein